MDTFEFMFFMDWFLYLWFLACLLFSSHTPLTIEKLRKTGGVKSALKIIGKISIAMIVTSIIL
ncbi:MAG: hypothetical protein PHD70_14640 [Anaerostipes sp.]|nr:hypothetical protein [Anaerostipes sp.]MDD3747695.1 hypothetical protein [Anaerostipes sp.]